MLAIPAHDRIISWPQFGSCCLIDVLRLEQRRLQLYGAGIHLQLMLWLRTEHHASAPSAISATAQQQ